MKKFIVRNADTVQSMHNMGKASKDFIIDGFEDMQVSDGYHTMDELYDHRIVLFIALCRHMRAIDQKFGSLMRIKQGETPVAVNEVWRSQLHSDGSAFEGWFILGIGKPAGEQITYHIPMKHWEETEFAETLEKAPEWDSHTSADVLERLKLI